MSTIPGYDLEAFLAWNFDFIVDGDTGANRSLEIAEAMGVETRRITISRADFLPIVQLCEPYREDVERHLSWYDEQLSWRDYSAVVTEQIPDAVWELLGPIVAKLRGLS